MSAIRHLSLMGAYGEASRAANAFMLLESARPGVASCRSPTATLREPSATAPPERPGRWRSKSLRRSAGSGPPAPAPHARVLLVLDPALAAAARQTLLRGPPHSLPHRFIDAGVPLRDVQIAA